MQSYNSYKLGSKFYRIINCLVEQEMTDGRSLTPLEITKKTCLNVNTVRVYLRRLLEKGVVNQPLYGHYCNSPSVGVGGGFGVLVHNVLLVFGGVEVERGVGACVEVVGDTEIKVRFGFKNRKVTAWISNDGGLNYDGFCFAMSRVSEIVLDKVGVHVERFPCSVSCEFNHDYQHLRLDGVSCVTFKSFLGDMERIYNKNSGLRSEVKVQNVTLESAYALLKGGVTPYNLMQTQFMLLKEVQDLVEQNKFLIEAFQEQNRFIKHLLEGKQGVKSL